MKGENIITPNQTLYINNLNDKMRKEDLKRTLYSLFMPFGRILDIVALKTAKMRGQAFIVFTDIQCATAAIRELQGFVVYDKPMKIAYCKSKSTSLTQYQKEMGDLEAYLSGDVPPKPDPEVEVEEEMEVELMHQASEAEVNKILFLENLPLDVTSETLVYLFQQYPGFREVRLIPGKPGLAFVDYDSEQQAMVPKNVLQGFKITPEHQMKISFAKR